MGYGMRIHTEAEFVEALRARGFKATPQRVVVYRIIRDQPGHLTAEELLTAASRELPNVSLPTVYAALGVLEELGLVQRIAALGGTGVYDSRLDLHQHAICRGCGSVQDLDVEVEDGDAVAAASAVGFTPERAQLTVQGLCAHCARPD
jgi:Fe2+ or Zn2+ uptake regulation protein